MTAYGQWIGASHVLGRPVPVDGPYPHICATTVDGRMTGRRFRLYPRDCPACAAPPTPRRETPMPDTLTLLAAALDLARHGLPVFMLGRSKRPVANCRACPKVEDDPTHDPEACPCLTCHGFYAASTDPDRIAAILDAVPSGLLAVRTGSVAGVAVVDIDPRNGGQVDPDLMPPTRATRTGNDGWHLWYRHPGGPLGAKVAGRAGVDVKADGGYVVVPPSIHPDTGRPYRWAGDRPIAAMPPALVDACQPVDGSGGVSRTSRTSRIFAGQGRYGFSAGTAQAVPAAPQSGAGGGRRPVLFLRAARACRRCRGDGEHLRAGRVALNYLRELHDKGTPR
ncbi:bifunctional DNA primase/polymerase [Rhizomonospora bruguierae]|uniref:bifunctional DNA primase/polymerase n=1 Tax=Rhizomonospora bruguierae TaxID=1581705 RepID=UPI00278BDA06|nr:bifunctional DNA primase/polymerase [Micromonospora sp. NBRC 107566]